MKLLFITGLKEYLPDISAVLRKAAIPVYSIGKATGIRTVVDADIDEDWFATGAGEYDSVFIFSFAEEEIVDKATALVRDHNQQHPTGFPLRAFVLPVDDHSY